MKIGIRYCGGCNPRYDRVAAAEQLKALFPKEDWIYAGPDTHCDGIAVVTGCGKECVPSESLGDYRGHIVYMNTNEDIPAAAETIRNWLKEDTGAGTGSERNSILIRRMTEADLPQVLEIEKENFSVPWSEKSFRDMISRPESVFLVAEETAGLKVDSGRRMPYLAGYAGAVTACDQGDVTNIAVRGTRKQRGIGDQLMKHLLEEARKKGAEEIFLEVREHNEPAKQLYRSNRFVEIGIRKGYYADTQEDAILMKRSLLEEVRTTGEKENV